MFTNSATNLPEWRDEMNSLNEAFDAVKEYCRERVSDSAYKLWVGCIEPVELNGSTIILSVESPFQKNIVLTKYRALLSEAFLEVLGFEVDIDVTCKEENQKNDGFSQNGKKQNFYPSDYDEKATAQYTFSNFIVGSGNKFAHAASVAVATKPSGSYNPLFIYGQSGLGKTHLLYAILNQIKENFNEQCIMYVKGEEFANELIDAIRTETTSKFHAKYRNADILLMDDVQFIGGKISTQEEFFHTFEALYVSGKQIVLTSDRPPKEIKTLEDRLRNRFESGLLADIQPPDFETRVAIIRSKSEELGCMMPDDVTECIANRLKSNIRQLEGTVKKLCAYNQIGSPPTVALAQTVMKEILNDNQPVPMTVERIVNEVAKTYGISAVDIRSTKRSSAISQARQVSMYVIREITQLSMSAIGEEFGGRDHSTVVYATKEVEKKMSRDRRYREIIDDIVKNIRDSSN